jgi:hypothetical protein
MNILLNYIWKLARIIQQHRYMTGCNYESKSKRDKG